MAIIVPNSLKLLHHYILSNAPPKTCQWALKLPYIFLPYGSLLNPLAFVQILQYINCHLYCTPAKCTYFLNTARNVFVPWNWKELTNNKSKWHTRTPTHGNFAWFYLDVKYFTTKPSQCSSQTVRRLHHALFSFENNYTWCYENRVSKP